MSSLRRCSITSSCGTSTIRSSIASSLLTKHSSRTRNQTTKARDGDSVSIGPAESTITCPTVGVNLPSRPMENTYRMEPKHRFPVAAVKKVIREVLHGLLDGKTYDPVFSTDRDFCSIIIERIKNHVKEILPERYRIVVYLSVSPANQTGNIRVGSKFLWNEKTDTFAEYAYNNGSITAVGTVFGVYTE